MCRLTHNREILNTDSSEERFLGRLFLLTVPGWGVGVSTWERRVPLCSSGFHSAVFMGGDVSSSAQSLSFVSLLPPAAPLLGAIPTVGFLREYLLDPPACLPGLVSLLPQLSSSVRTSESRWFSAHRSFPFFLSSVSFMHTSARNI